MPVVNPLARELVFKVVYYGPGLGGKTTSLQHIHAATKPEHRGKMVSLATPVDRTLYFDFLPIRVPHVRGMGVRLQLFTVPGQVYYNATRKLVLTGADGVVMVYDSQALRLDANIESLENLCDNLREHGRALVDLPHVIQYNKRDLLEVSAIHELEPKLNRQRCPAFATVAIRGDGVFEALEAITRAVLDDFDRRMPEMRGTAVQQLELPEGGLAEALRRAEGTSTPPSRALVSQAQSVPHRPSSSALRLSSLPEADPGEDAARAITAARHATPPPPLLDPADVIPLTPRSSVSPPKQPERKLPADGSSGGRRPAGGLADGPSGGRRPAGGLADDGKAVLEPRADKVDDAAKAAEELLSVAPPANVPAQAEPTPASRIDMDSKPRAEAPAPGSVAAVVPLVAPTTASMSFEALWPLAERATVRELEQLLASGNHAQAVTVVDQLVARSLASAANMLGTTADAPRDPAVVALLLGIDGRRYLEFRALLREARSGRPIEPAEALAAFALAIDIRLARSKLGG